MQLPVKWGVRAYIERANRQHFEHANEHTILVLMDAMVELMGIMMLLSS